uniref:Transposon protein, putative, unclassified n=1 Tax=Oryza sativa subsp. japonica TaxID=39947 RepID=Q2QU39_ORYSJ|nr:transposon protein, putative, unclassified [Oryza sativa Japonica Group]
MRRVRSTKKRNPVQTILDFFGGFMQCTDQLRPTSPLSEGYGSGIPSTLRYTLRIDMAYPRVRGYFLHNLRKLLTKSIDGKSPSRTRTGLPTYCARSSVFESYSESIRPMV